MIKNAVRNFAVCWGAIWCHIKNRNIGAQLQSLTCIKDPKLFWKIYFLYDFWCTQTCSFRAVFGLPIRSLTLLSASYGKKLYRCTSTFPALNYCSVIFFKSLSYLSIRTGAHKLFRRFLDFIAIFDRNFAKIVAPPSDEYENYVMHWKGQSLLKKRCKRRRNRHINGNAMLVRTVHPSTAQCSGLGAWPKNKHHIFASTAGARCTIFPKLCMVIELVGAIEKGEIQFSIQRIVYPTGCTEKFGLIDWRAVSQQ